MLVGAVFTLLAAIGIVRLPDLYTRMHAASKAGSVGAGFILIAVALGVFRWRRCTPGYYRHPVFTADHAGFGAFIGPGKLQVGV